MQRLRFVKLAVKAQKSMAVLCREFGLSRRVGYKWKKRFERDGLRGLRDGSRRPKRCPRQISAQWLRRIRRLRRRHRSWGSRKLAARLRREHPGRKCPSARTIGKWLKRLGLNRHSRRRTRRGPPVKRPPLTMARRSNHVWTVDFKGWFRTGNGERCEPLTVRDAFSRYGLLADPSAQGPELEAGATGVWAALRPEWLPESHSRGQWPSLWIHRADGAFEFERLVDGPRDTRRIYCSGASRRRMARTNRCTGCSKPRRRGRQRVIAEVNSIGVPDRFGNQNRQSGPTASGVWPSGRQPKSITDDREELPATQALRLCQGNGQYGKCAAMAKSNGAGRKAIHRRSVCRTTHRFASAETWHWRQGAGLFCRAVGRRVVAVRPRRDASHHLCARRKPKWTRQTAGKALRQPPPRAASWCSRRSGSLRSPALREHQDAANLRSQSCRTRI